MSNLARAWARMAAHQRFAQEYGVAYHVLARFPIYTVRGASRHHLLNGSLFEKVPPITTEQWRTAKALQDAERLNELLELQRRAMEFQDEAVPVDEAREMLDRGELPRAVSFDGLPDSRTRCEEP